MAPARGGPPCLTAPRLLVHRDRPGDQVDIAPPVERADLTDPQARLAVLRTAPGRQQELGVSSGEQRIRVVDFTGGVASDHDRADEGNTAFAVGV